MVEVSSLSLSFSDYLPSYLPTYLPTYQSIYLSYPILSYPIYLSFYHFLSISIYPSIYLSVCLSVHHPKRSNSARLPKFLNLTTSKTKQFCETSFKNGKLSAELTASYQCVLRFYHFTCLKYCACHEKVMPGHAKCCTCHAKSSSQN